MVKGNSHTMLSPKTKNNNFKMTGKDQIIWILGKIKNENKSLQFGENPWWHLVQFHSTNISCESTMYFTPETWKQPHGDYNLEEERQVNFQLQGNLLNST